VQLQASNGQWSARQEHSAAPSNLTGYLLALPDHCISHTGYFLALPESLTHYICTYSNHTISTAITPPSSHSNRDNEKEFCSGQLQEVQHTAI
jgi:hypothetical protein